MIEMGLVGSSENMQKKYHYRQLLLGGMSTKPLLYGVLCVGLGGVEVAGLV